MGALLPALGTLLGALALTILIEAPVAAVLGLRTRHAQAVLACINAVTNPALTLILAVLQWFSLAPASPFSPVILALEAFVVLVEAILLHFCLRLPPFRSFRLSLACNGISWLCGALLLW